MPLYDFCCTSCGTVENVWAGINEESMPCPKCHEHQATRLFSPPRNIICDLTPYWDENISKNGQPVYVESRQHKAKLLKQNGLKMSDSISDYR